MTSRFGRLDVKIESGTQVASRGTDMAQGDAAGVNGSNRILFHGAPLLLMMPNGCLGSPVIVLLFGLDRGFLMDVGPFLKEFVKPKRFPLGSVYNGSAWRRRLVYGFP
jgi:hypothetical protein